jgi:putative ABC transport system substrate-binding protein
VKSRAVALALGVAVAVLATPPVSRAQPAPRVPRIALLCATQCGPMMGGFEQGLRELEYIDGQNIVVDLRGAGAADDQLPRAAAELIRRKVDVIVAGGSSAAVWAAKRATTTIPIVMAISDEAVESGLIGSLSRPGGNITGLTVPQTDLLGKQLELLKEAVPGLSRVAVLWSPANPSHPSVLKKIGDSARSLGIQVEFLEVRGPIPDFNSVFSAAASRRANAALVLSDYMLTRGGNRLALVALQRRFPSVSTFSDFASGGGLLTYGPSLSEMLRQAAIYVDRILKGARPGDLPVQQPTRYELAINLTTAKALGLTIPDSLLVRADQVIR